MQKGSRMKRAKHEARVRRMAKLGDALTHTRCLGCIEEHIYTGIEGSWLRGKPTADTLRLGGLMHEANDISPRNVTHINRVVVEVAEFLAEVQKIK